jgi:hypothetical protein
MRIAFDSDRNSPESPDGGGHELYSMNADGSCVTWLTNGPAESTGTDWQPGAGLATDPGPLCGAAPRPPTFDVDAAPLARFKRFQAYWLGQTFGNLLLSALVGPDVIYGDCAAYSPGDCGASVQLQNRSVCERNPFTYGRGLAGGVPSRRVRFRGAILAAYPSAGGWDLYTGRTSTTIFGTHLTLRDAEAVVRSLRTARALAPSKRRLPAPAFPAAFWRKLHRFTAAYARLGSAAAVARELRVSTRAARDKLALARMLRGLGARREVRCSRA